jgi:hypothetical protein
MPKEIAVACSKVILWYLLENYEKSSIRAAGLYVGNTKPGPPEYKAGVHTQPPLSAPKNRLENLRCVTTLFYILYGNAANAMQYSICWGRKRCDPD